MKERRKKNKGDPKSLDEAPLKLSVTQAAVLWCLQTINMSHKMKSKMFCDGRTYTHTKLRPPVRTKENRGGAQSGQLVDHDIC